MVRQRSHEAHQRQKQVKDQTLSGEAFQVGDRVWLFVPAIKKGQTKKFASLWRGPYTIIDKVGPVNYHVQLIGGTQKRIVHRNRLKHCLSDPNPGHLPETTAHATISEGDGSSGTDVGTMQDVAYQEQEVVPDATEDDIIQLRVRLLKMKIRC